MRLLSPRLGFAWAVLFAVSIFAFGGFNAQAPAAPSPNTVAATSTQAYYTQRVNELRASKNLPPVRLLVELNDSAQTKADHMAANHYWSHTTPTGVSFADFIFKEVPNAALVGENLARCFAANDKAFAALVDSPTHYAIMVGNFNYIGIAQSYDASIGCTVTAMHFARI